jgi:hypothetical protein
MLVCVCVCVCESECVCLCAHEMNLWRAAHAGASNTARTHTRARTIKKDFVIFSKWHLWSLATIHKLSLDTHCEHPKFCAHTHIDFQAPGYARKHNDERVCRVHLDPPKYFRLCADHHAEELKPRLIAVREGSLRWIFIGHSLHVSSWACYRGTFCCWHNSWRKGPRTASLYNNGMRWFASSWCFLHFVRQFDNFIWSLGRIEFRILASRQKREGILPQKEFPYFCSIFQSLALQQVKVLDMPKKHSHSVHTIYLLMVMVMDCPSPVYSRATQSFDLFPHCHPTFVLVYVQFWSLPRTRSTSCCSSVGQSERLLTARS